MNDQQNPSGVNGKFLVLEWPAIAVAVALLVTLRQGGLSVTNYGFEITVWLVAALFFVIGMAAGRASFMARRG